MDPNEDLIEVLSFQLDLLRLATAPHGCGRAAPEPHEAEELEQILQRLPLGNR